MSTHTSISDFEVHPIGTTDELQRLRKINAELLDALYFMLNMEGPAAVGVQCGAFHGLDVPYHFNKARTAIANATKE